MCQITLWKNIFPTMPRFARRFMLKKSITIVEEDLVFLQNSREVKTRTGKPDLLVTPSDEVTFEFTRIWDQNLKKHEGVSAQ
jgi:hypothetical protein